MTKQPGDNMYRIAGKFCGRKFRNFVLTQTFHGFNFAISDLQKISLAGKLLSWKECLGTEQ